MRLPIFDDLSDGLLVGHITRDRDNVTVALLLLGLPSRDNTVKRRFASTNNVHRLGTIGGQRFGKDLSNYEPFCEFWFKGAVRKAGSKMTHVQIHHRLE